jgi:hypothetical protein
MSKYTTASEDLMIAALLREREGYVAFGKKDRVKAVDEELKRRGWEDPEAKKQPPKERAGRESQQATADDAKPAVKAEAVPAKKAAEARKSTGK